MVIEQLESAGPSSPAGPLTERGRRFAVVAFSVGAFIITIWAVMIAFYAAPGARVLWTGLDTAEAVVLALVAWLTHRRDRRVSLPAAALTAMILTDTWVDVATAPPSYLPVSLIMAVTLELPFAAGCAFFALRTFRASAPAYGDSPSR